MDAFLVALAATMIRQSPSGPAMCGDGNGFYDPVHQVCQPYMPSDPQPGYGQFCPDGNQYDPMHGVCAPYGPAYPPPMYPDY